MRVELPFEFIVLGIPVSHQTRNREKLRSWRTTVSRNAQESLGEAVISTDAPVSLTIVYYHAAGSPDVDNIVKPIQDGLIGVVFRDDSQVSDVRCSRRNLNGSFYVRGISAALAEGFVAGEDFVYVRVDDAPAQEILP